MLHRNLAIGVLLAGAVVLSGCNTTEAARQPPVVITEWPQIPDVQPPVSEKPPEYKLDYPRKPNGQVDTQSNLYIGFTKEEFDKFMQAQEITASREPQWRNTLSGINGLFKTWRERKVEEDAKLKAEQELQAKAAAKKKKRFGIF